MPVDAAIAAFAMTSSNTVRRCACRTRASLRSAALQCALKCCALWWVVHAHVDGSTFTTGGAACLGVARSSCRLSTFPGGGWRKPTAAAAGIVRLLDAEVVARPTGRPFQWSPVAVLPSNCSRHRPSLHVAHVCLGGGAAWLWRGDRKSAAAGGKAAPRTSAACSPLLRGLPRSSTAAHGRTSCTPPVLGRWLALCTTRRQAGTCGSRPTAGRHVAATIGGGILAWVMGRSLD